MKLWKKGLIVFGAGIVLNVIMMNLGIHGLLREFARFIALAGLGIVIFGVITKK